MTKILAIDIETGGLDETKDPVLEVAAVIWDIEQQTHFDIFSSLIEYSGDTAKPVPCQDIHGINWEMVGYSWNVPIEIAMRAIALRALDCYYYLAHNAVFESKFLKHNFKLHGLDWIQKPWLDTTTDLPYPDKIKSKSLPYLCADHGFLNPFSHRALFDAFAALKLFTMYPWEQVKELAASPLCEVIALVSYDKKDLAKDARFYWDPTRKVWHRSCKEAQLEKMKKQWGFDIDVRRIDPL